MLSMFVLGLHSEWIGSHCTLDGILARRKEDRFLTAFFAISEGVYDDIHTSHGDFRQLKRSSRDHASHVMNKWHLQSIGH